MTDTILGVDGVVNSLGVIQKTRLRAVRELVSAERGRINVRRFTTGAYDDDGNPAEIFELSVCTLDSQVKQLTVSVDFNQFFKSILGRGDVPCEYRIRE